MTTMAKFHVNAAGNAGKCTATAGKCPFGDASEHFDTVEDARASYEAKQTVGMFAKLKQNKFLKRAVTAGAMTAVAVSLVGCSSIAKDDGASAPYQEPAAPVATAEEAPAPEPAEQSGPTAQEVNDQLDKAYAGSKEWLEKNGPGISEKAKEYWDQYGSTGATGTSPNPADVSGIMWQGKNLTPTPEEVASAQATLDSLVVAPESGAAYDRESQFGRGFKTGIAGAIEHRDVPTATFKNATPQARVVDGHFTDPYTGLDVHVIGGESADADIDHLVPLSEAWDSGAANLSKDQRVALANDMDNLVYVESSVNRSKSDKDAAEFLPSYEPAQCAYVVSQISVKGKYQLSVDTAEKAALQQVISSRCQ